MANETRIRANSMSGTIDNNPLTNSGTTLTSDELIALPAVGGTEHLVLVLDPTGAGNGPEIVYVTAHVAASSNATIVRGREGSSGVQHTSIRSWVHGPVVSDWPGHVTAATRPSGSGLPYEGQFIYETDTDAFLFYDGTTWKRTSHHIPHSQAARAVGTGTRSTTSASYADIATDEPTLSFTKYRDDTRLIVSIQGSCYISADNGGLTLGISVNGTDYDVVVAQLSTANKHESLCAYREITGVAAFSGTVKFRWKVAGGNTLSMDIGDTMSIKIEESM